MAMPKAEGPANVRLFRAIETGDSQAVRELLEEDPRLATARNNDGASALLLATYYRQVPITKLLLERGAVPDLFEAAALGHDDRAADLLRGDRALVHRYSHDGWTPLHLAAHFGRVEVMKTLLANGADHRAVSKNSNRNQPLQAAAAGGQTAAVELLIRVGADVNHRSHGGFTALMIAASNGRRPMVEALLKAGAEVNAETGGGMTALDYAIKGDHAEIVDVLEAAGGLGGKAR